VIDLSSSGDFVAEGRAMDVIDAVSVAKQHLADRSVIKEAGERYLESRPVADRGEFLWLGLTDTALLHAASDDCALLTADSGLYMAAAGEGMTATNFHHHRRL
jgi:hypothetical protein